MIKKYSLSLPLQTSSLKKINLFFAGLILVYLFFCYQMLKITLQYIPYNTDVAFLRIKQDVIDAPFYKIAFFTHVYTAMFVLIAGFTQFSIYLRKHYRELHKVSGWIHRKYMIRSFALTLSAITLRAWKYALVFLFEPRPMDVYQLAAWLGWIPNLIIAEIIIYKLFLKPNLKS
ncbi:MAG: DUF2306 domain-containing protein [Ignavibacteria bacterium]|nr:DUF2306 domain-containing protein [Ignavibacteria bacterium]